MWFVTENLFVAIPVFNTTEPNAKNTASIILFQPFWKLFCKEELLICMVFLPKNFIFSKRKRHRITIKQPQKGWTFQMWGNQCCISKKRIPICLFYLFIFFFGGVQRSYSKLIISHHMQTASILKVYWVFFNTSLFIFIITRSCWLNLLIMFWFTSLPVLHCFLVFFQLDQLLRWYLPTVLFGWDVKFMIWLQ